MIILGGLSPRCIVTVYIVTWTEEHMAILQDDGSDRPSQLRVCPGFRSTVRVAVP
jgi:hypothetical protein